MPLATERDVKARLGRELTETEEGRMEGLLVEASELVLGHCRRNAFPTPVPDAAVIVTSRAVARALSTKPGTEGLESTQMSAGPYQTSRNYSEDSTSGGPWLTKSDRAMLRRHRLGVVSVATW